MPSRFAITLFASASLLFVCQPMIARMIVPLLGGAPAVWILCSLCFQGLVLAGYLYAHVVGSRLRVRTQVLLQVALLIAAFVVLPVVIDERVVESLTSKSRTLGLLLVLMRSVGLPFFVLSTTSPLLQRWYAELGETDPYYLYAASNAGSMLALLGYPFAVEPFLALKEQGRFFQVGFVIYAGLVVVCAIAVLKGKRVPEASAIPSRLSLSPPSEAPTPGSVWRERLVWLALSFAPSTLLMGSTAFITTDLASVPLLWVIPLALYLASFMVAFAKTQALEPPMLSRVLALIAAVVAVAKMADIVRPASAVVALHLTFLFVASVVCHRALALRRPHHRRLTEFYLVLSLGGVLGGAFNGLVAPFVFNDLYEYPIAIALVCFARVALEPPAAGGDRRSLLRDIAFGVGLAISTYALLKVGVHASSGTKLGLLWYVVPVIVAFTWSKRPVRYAVALAGILLVSRIQGGLLGNTVHKERGFFGVLKVHRDPTEKRLLLLYGNTIHGAQNIDVATRNIPLTYFFPTGPAGDVLGPLPGTDAPDGPPLAARHIGVIGLGVGSLAAYARPDDTWTFFELDPRVVPVARTYFSFLAGVPRSATLAIEIGDARLRLRDGESGRFDILVLDAFNSDAIPVHLLTREAVAIYRRSLRPGGVLLAHITNRHVELEPVLATLADDAHMLAIGRFDTEIDGVSGKLGSRWVCLSDSAASLLPLAAKNKEWRTLVAVRNQKPWTDDFANVLSAMHF